MEVFVPGTEADGVVTPDGRGGIHPPAGFKAPLNRPIRVDGVERPIPTPNVDGTVFPNSGGGANARLCFFDSSCSNIAHGGFALWNAL
jgi:hypothetical protein